MPSTIDTILSYSKREVETKFGKGTITDFETQNGLTLSTFKGEVASQATLLMNQPVEIEYSVKQNGEYTNYTLLGVKASDKPIDAPLAAITNKDTAIAKAVALKAAVDTISNLDLKVKTHSEVVTLADFYLEWLSK